MGRKIAILFLFIAGISLFFYPIVSHWLKTQVHYKVMRKYDEEVAKMSEEDRLLQLKKAEEYNEKISSHQKPIEDPFSTEEEQEGFVGYFNMLQIGEAMAQIEIPSINVHLPIYHGVSEKVLSRGVGHMSNSSLPIGGLGNHAALTAHRGLPSTKLFRDLDKVKEGDVFYIHTLGEVLAYEVDQIKIVLPTETEWLEMNEEKDYVTLITCEPYMINTHRLLVRGVRVPYTESEQVVRSSYALEKQELTSSEKHIEEPTVPVKQIVIYSMIGVGSLILVVFLFRKRRRPSA